MKLFQHEARPLPVLVRPLGGETIPSFTRRLSEANDLPSTTMLRALGHLHGSGSGLHLLDRDAELNTAAMERLSIYSAISVPHLKQALPALTWRHHLQSQIGPFPPGIPALRCYRPTPPARPACTRCASRAFAAAATTPPLLRPAATPLICRAHRRWLGPGPRNLQLDISTAGEILTAQRRYQRLATRLAREHGDHSLARTELGNAHRIVSSWAGAETTNLRPLQIKVRLRYRPFPHLRVRWQERAARLGLPNAEHHPTQHPAVTFPEAVTLTEILTDLTWRRHVALVSEHDLARFRKRIGRRFGQQDLPHSIWGQDELQTWMHILRHRFIPIRNELNAAAKTAKPWEREIPFPELSLFT